MKEKTNYEVRVASEKSPQIDLSFKKELFYENLLESFLRSRLTCNLSSAPLSLQNVGIQLYDPFEISENCPEPTAPVPSDTISLRSKSSKNFKPKLFSQNLLKAPSAKYLSTKIETENDDSRHYFFYDELNKSRSRHRIYEEYNKNKPRRRLSEELNRSRSKKLTPINKRGRSPYSSNWTFKVIKDLYNSRSNYTPARKRSLVKSSSKKKRKFLKSSKSKSVIPSKI